MIFVIILLFILYGLVHVCYQLLVDDLFDTFLKCDFKRKLCLGDLRK